MPSGIALTLTCRRLSKHKRSFRGSCRSARVQRRHAINPNCRPGSACRPRVYSASKADLRLYCRHRVLLLLWLRGDRGCDT